MPPFVPNSMIWTDQPNRTVFAVWNIPEILYLFLTFLIAKDFNPGIISAGEMRLLTVGFRLSGRAGIAGQFDASN